jgi:hypothetical protein
MWVCSSECPNYDLCESCHAEHGPTHDGHPMHREVPPPTRARMCVCLSVCPACPNLRV